MTHSEQDLKTAILLIHFYNGYDATPLKNIEGEDEQHYGYDSNEYEINDYDENY